MKDTLKALRQANKDRTVRWNLGGTTDPRVEMLFRGMELGGEAGELLNALKKHIRHLSGSRGNRETPEQIMQNIRDELAGVIICTDRVAQMLDVDLTVEVPRKFNQTSDKVGVPVYMELPA